MRGKAACLLLAVCMAVLVTGCHEKTETLQATGMQEEKPVFVPTPKKNSLPETEPEEPAEEEDALNKPFCVKSEEEINITTEDTQRIVYAGDALPADTVAFLDSSKEEIRAIRYIESVVDEDDPSTYQIVRREVEEQAEEEVPIEYTDPSGHVKYAYIDDTWYEYRYSSGELMLDVKNEELALMFLNMDGSYDDFEIENIECMEVTDENGNTQYKYSVLYKKTIAMTEPPQEVEGLTVTKSTIKTVARTRVVKEKVPVMIEEEVGTGEYIYHGWQVFDGNMYYFDESGEKLTGSHVIRGIRHMFDSDGVKISRAGIAVSSQNGSIDWGKIRAAGIEIAMIRCAFRGFTNGDLILDSKLAEHLAGARAAGIDVGIYLFSQAVSEEEAVQEAELAAELAGKYQISRPVVLALSYANPSCSGRADGLSAADRTEFVRAFESSLRQAGYASMLCAEKDWMAHCLEMERLGSFPLWLVQYNSNVTYTGPYEIWQYTSRGILDGVSGNISLYISYGK